ncbi:MAG: response regulator [Candidatus Omnitrophota bacterium]
MAEQQKKNILIVEDDQDQAMALAMYAKGKGYTPRVAYDATFAIMSLHKVQIDLVILDIGLPGGGGLFVLENLKRSVQTFDVPVVILTAKIEEGLEKKARDKGASAFFTKPCPMETLFGAIEKILNPPPSDTAV